jgi:signal transduction histidine kinase
VRIALAVFALANGYGIAVYVLAWLLLPQQGESSGIGVRALSDLRGIALSLALTPLLVVALLLASLLHTGWLGSLAWPIVISAAGLILIWRNAPEDERVAMRRVAEPLAHIGIDSRRSWSALLMRAVLGVVLVGIGVVVLLFVHVGSTLRPLAGIGLVTAGLVVVFGPWWLNVARELVAERQARVRAEERANMAARVHDSVLQTLAMIQRNADSPQDVVRLARAQERELRSWLFEGRLPGSVGEEADTLAAGVRCIQQDVEDAHGVPVEIVTVGDCPLTDDLRALLAAGREATVNAAKWSGAPEISLFAEATDTTVSLFVRDRGVGFDPAAVPRDRQGIAESVRGRMSRHGGTAVVHSAVGQGTEIELTMPRTVGRPHQRSAPA